MGAKILIISANKRCEMIDKKEYNDEILVIIPKSLDCLSQEAISQVGEIVAGIQKNRVEIDDWDIIVRHLAICYGCLRAVIDVAKTLADES
jgi:hypothetical protein